MKDKSSRRWQRGSKGILVALIMVTLMVLMWTQMGSAQVIFPPGGRIIGPGGLIIIGERNVSFWDYTVDGVNKSVIMQDIMIKGPTEDVGTVLKNSTMIPSTAGGYIDTVGGGLISAEYYIMNWTTGTENYTANFTYARITLETKKSGTNETISKCLKGESIDFGLSTNLEAIGPGITIIYVVVDPEGMQKKIEVSLDANGSNRYTFNGTDILGTYTVYAKTNKSMCNGLDVASSEINFDVIAESMKTWYVPDDYPTIQAAVNNATAGDTIIVRDSTYTENVDVDKRLTIKSENGSASTIVQAANPDDHVFEVTADYVEISGFTVKGATGDLYYPAGIYLYSADSANVSNNNASNNQYGIYLSDSDYNSISNNNCSNNDADIYLSYSNNNRISNNMCDDVSLFLGASNNNTISNNKIIGIYLKSSSNNKLTNNVMVEGGVAIEGSVLSHYIHDIDGNNTVNGKPVYYLKNVEGGRVPDGAGQIILANCTKVIVENQEFKNVSVGIEVAFSFNITIENNNCSLNEYGILLLNSNKNSISNNNCSNNNYGVTLVDSSNNTIKNNNCSNNRIGIYPYDSNNNFIYLNNFINNAGNVYSYDSTNIWNSTEEITYSYNDSEFENYLGNYWSDYKGSDADGDGIGDTPYSIDSDKDNYPLMKSWENYFASIKNIFDTGSPANPYPSIMGNHTGTIKPNHTVIASKMYTYPCEGTGGHTEYARIWNSTWNATATWSGYIGDWHNLTFDTPAVLSANETYNYTICTGSYPQIHHTDALPTANGWINCTKFIDVNGKEYNDWILAIRLE